MRMTLLFWVKHDALTVKERRVIVTVWVVMRVIVVTLNFHHHKRRSSTRSGRSATSFAFR